MTAKPPSSPKKNSPTTRRPTRRHLPDREPQRPPPLHPAHYSPHRGRPRRIVVTVTAKNRLDLASSDARKTDLTPKHVARCIPLPAAEAEEARATGAPARALPFGPETALALGDTFGPERRIGGQSRWALLAEKAKARSRQRIRLMLRREDSPPASRTCTRTSSATPQRNRWVAEGGGETDLMPDHGLEVTQMLRPMAPPKPDERAVEATCEWHSANKNLDQHRLAKALRIRRATVSELRRS